MGKSEEVDPVFSVGDLPCFQVPPEVEARWLMNIDEVYHEESVQPKARDSIHVKVLDWFSQQEKGSVLDIPAGYGHLSLKLQQAGFEVTAGEITPEIFQPKDIECGRMDLNEKLPLDDSAFEYVCCLEGIEHTTNPYRAIEELARVLKVGGKLVLSLPNYNNIENRLKYVFYGFFDKPPNLERFREVDDCIGEFHNSPLNICLLDFMFELNGLSIDSIEKNAAKPKQHFLAPLVWLIRIAHSLSSDRKREERKSKLTTHRNVILGGNTLILILRKTGKPVSARKS